MGQFLIVCRHLPDNGLHDSTKDTITLVCQLIQNYFKNIFIPYRTVIFSSYKKGLLIYFDCYNHSFIQIGQNGISLASYCLATQY